MSQRSSFESTPQGIDLNSADFILTLMSVHVKEARHRLEDFARAAKIPSTQGASPYNHFHAPSPDQLLRVAVGLGLKRGVLQNAYQALRGRDPKTKEVSEELRDEAVRQAPCGPGPGAQPDELGGLHGGGEACRLPLR